MVKRRLERYTLVHTSLDAWMSSDRLVATASMSSVSSRQNCAVILECTTGLGDMVFDVISGVPAARASSCARPTVFTKFQMRHDAPPRHYDWPALVHSRLFRMAPPVRSVDVKKSGGPWRGPSNRSRAALWQSDRLAQLVTWGVWKDDGPT